jgi:hypothetical protein
MKVHCPNCGCDFDTSGMIKSKPRQIPPTDQGQTIILEGFADLSGIRFNPLPPDIARQARQFHKHFTLADLELVIAYTRWAITKDMGFTPQSLTWRKLMHDAPGFGIFQDRLGAAKEALKARRFTHRPKYQGNERLPEQEPKPATTTAPAPADDTELRQQALDGLEALKRQLRHEQ